MKRLDELYHVDFFGEGIDPMNKENLNLNLVLTEELPPASLEDPEGIEGLGTRTMHIPTLFYPYAMRLVTSSKAYYLQFFELDFLKGYTILCTVLGLNPKEHCQAYRVKNKVG